jgi:hypothetical protein
VQFHNDRRLLQTRNNCRVQKVELIPLAITEDERPRPNQGTKHVGSARPPNDNPVTNVVDIGESLGSIAKKYGVSVGELMKANNITDAKRIGRRAILELEELKAWVREQGLIPPKVYAPESEIAEKGWQSEPKT